MKSKGFGIQPPSAVFYVCCDSFKGQIAAELCDHVIIVDIDFAGVKIVKARGLEHCCLYDNGLPCGNGQRKSEVWDSSLIECFVKNGAQIPVGVVFGRIFG